MASGLLKSSFESGASTSGGGVSDAALDALALQQDFPAMDSIFESLDIDKPPRYWLDSLQEVLGHSSRRAPSAQPQGLAPVQQQEGSQAAPSQGGWPQHAGMHRPRAAVATASLGRGRAGNSATTQAGSPDSVRGGEMAPLAGPRAQPHGAAAAAAAARCTSGCPTPQPLRGYDQPATSAEQYALQQQPTSAADFSAQQWGQAADQQPAASWGARAPSQQHPQQRQQEDQPTRSWGVPPHAHHQQLGQPARSCGAPAPSQPALSDPSPLRGDQERQQAATAAAAAADEQQRTALLLRYWQLTCMQRSQSAGQSEASVAPSRDGSQPMPLLQQQQPGPLPSHKASLLSQQQRPAPAQHQQQEPAQPQAEMPKWGSGSVQAAPAALPSREGSRAGLAASGAGGSGDHYAMLAAATAPRKRQQAQRIQGAPRAYGRLRPGMQHVPVVPARSPKRARSEEAGPAQPQAWHASQQQQGQLPRQQQEQQQHGSGGDRSGLSTPPISWSPLPLPCYPHMPLPGGPEPDVHAALPHQNEPEEATDADDQGSQAKRARVEASREASKERDRERSRRARARKQEYVKSLEQQNGVLRQEVGRLQHTLWLWATQGFVTPDQALEFLASTSEQLPDLVLEYKGKALSH